MATVSVTFRVDGALRGEFVTVAQGQHVSAQHVLRELMRDYVAENKPVISADDVSPVVPVSRIE